jgi:hypothetical protein
MADRSHHGKREHDERNMAVPAMPGAGLVVIEPKLGFCSLETVLDGPAMAFDADKRGDVGSRSAQPAEGCKSPSKLKCPPCAGIFNSKCGDFSVPRRDPRCTIEPP